MLMCIISNCFHLKRLCIWCACVRLWIYSSNRTKDKQKRKQCLLGRWWLAHFRYALLAYMLSVLLVFIFQCYNLHESDGVLNTMWLSLCLSGSLQFESKIPNRVALVRTNGFSETYFAFLGISHLLMNTI